MSAVLARRLDGYRYVLTQVGDDLQAVALRTLGDANRWFELVWLNNLLPPYLTDDPDLASDRVLRTGESIKVPSIGAPSTANNTDAVLGSDCVVVDGLLQEDLTGDFGIVSGRANLKMQLTHRLDTIPGELRRHPNYGCRTKTLVGTMNGPAAGLLGANYTQTALQSDYRVESVTRSIATIAGNVCQVDAEVQPIGGGTKIDLSSAGAWNPWPFDNPPPDPEFPDQEGAGWGNNFGNSFGG